MRLRGKVAIVTGGGSGIGRATAQLFAEEGARVLVADYDIAKAQSVADAITAAGGEAWAWHVDAANTAAYVASKGGVTLLTRAMAIDHARHHVRVNAIAPGLTDTPMLRENLSADALERFARTFPMQRLGQPKELAQAALFLASDEASFVTGAILAVDGGQTAQV